MTDNDRPIPELDRSIFALVVKIGHYPWHHGGVGAIRSLGRAGVPVYAVTEDRWTPAALSRHLHGGFVWPTTGLEDPAWLVDGLLDMGSRIGRPTVLVPTDDEAAVLIAEHAEELRAQFLFPDIDPSLPRRVASKSGLYELCVEHGIPTPRSAAPTNVEELEKFAERAEFPVIAKNPEAFERLRAPTVNGTTRIDHPDQLFALARTWGENFSVLLQEYLPREHAEDWIVHAYSDESADCLVQFTGVKVRSYPAHAGMTTCAYSVHNPALKDLAARFVKNIDFHGVFDLDWRYDRRTGLFNLLDFNPRVGAQFRLFETEAGIDVVRALHLGMSGRGIPPSPQIDARRFLVETLDPASVLTSRDGSAAPSKPARAASTELAWLARDDMRPALAAPVRFLPMVIRRLRRVWKRNRPGYAGVRCTSDSTAASSRPGAVTTPMNPSP